jgi:hypothetical protein
MLKLKEEFKNATATKLAVSPSRVGVEFAWQAQPSNQALQPTAGRFDNSLPPVKRFPVLSACAVASGG